MASTVALPFSLWSVSSVSYKHLVDDVGSSPTIPSDWVDTALEMSTVEVEGPQALLVAQGLLEAATRIGAGALFGERGLRTWERFITRLRALTNDLELVPSLLSAPLKSDPVAHIGDIDLFVEPYLLGVLTAELVTQTLLSPQAAREVDTSGILSLSNVGVEREEIVRVLTRVLEDPQDRALCWHPSARWLNDFGGLNSVLVACGAKPRWRVVDDAVWGQPVLASSSEERLEGLVSEAAILTKGDGVSPFTRLDDATFAVDEAALAVLDRLSPSSTQLQAQILRKR